jgi:hypothetical protein
VRDAMAVAHQLSIRWALSPLSSQRRIMTIGIAAGDFSVLDVYLQAILSAKLPGDPVIRLTDYARQCVLVNDIRTIFCQEPKEIEIFDGEIVNIWWVTELWNTHYWDFVPALLRDDMLQTDPQSEERLSQILWFPDEQHTSTEREKRYNAVTTYLRTPQNSMLGLEIAKTLYYRRKFAEANEILRIVLSTEPFNLTARTLRLAIFSNLGLDESLPYSVCEIYFKRVEMEVAFIEENCLNKDEDFYCEYAYSKLAHALRVLHLIRKHGGKYQENDLTLTKEDVYKLLSESENIFMRAATVSFTGHRSFYMVGCVRSLRRMIKKDEDFLKTTNKELLDRDNICRETAQELFNASFWFREDYDHAKKYEFFRKRLENAAVLYTDSVVLRTRQPNIKFTFAVLLFDLSPILTVGMIRKILGLLEGAVIMAKNLEEDKVCLVSVTGVSARIVRIELFIEHVQKGIEQIKDRLKTIEDFEGKADTDLIDQDIMSDITLFCLNL